MKMIMEIGEIIGAVLFLIILYAVASRKKKSKYY
jgi:hypothetical protein